MEKRSYFIGLGDCSKRLSALGDLYIFFMTLFWKPGLKAFGMLPVASLILILKECRIEMFGQKQGEREKKKN